MTPDAILALFKKYMNHVGECEGVYFIGASLDNDPAFSDEERAFLRDLADQIRRDYVGG